MASFSCTDEFWGGIKLNIILSYCGVKDFLSTLGPKLQGKSTR